MWSNTPTTGTNYSGEQKVDFDAPVPFSKCLRAQCICCSPSINFFQKAGDRLAFILGCHPVPVFFFFFFFFCDVTKTLKMFTYDECYYPISHPATHGSEELKSWYCDETLKEAKLITKCKKRNCRIYNLRRSNQLVYNLSSITFHSLMFQLHLNLCTLN